MTLEKLYKELANIQGETADLCFHVKGCLFPVEIPEKARDELANLLRQAELFSA